MHSSPISISLKDLILKGEFGPIKLGMMRDKVVSILGEPEAVANMSNSRSRRRLKPGFIVYGDIEFYFMDETDQLHMIYSDHVSEFKGGSRIVLDLWIIRGGAPRKEIEKTFNAIDVRFNEIKPWDSTSSRIRTDSGVTLVFVEIEEDCSPPVGLYAFFLSDKNSNE